MNMIKSVIVGGLLSLLSIPALAASNPYNVSSPPYLSLGSNQYPLDNIVDVTWMGAKGDGTTNDTSAIQSVINGVKPGSTVMFPQSSNCYKITSALTVSKAINIVGPGVICQATGASDTFDITSSNVSIRNLTINGPYGLSPIIQGGNVAAIKALGVLNPGNPPTYISGLSISGVTIMGYADNGISLEYLDGFSISDVVVRYTAYSGILILSSQHGRVINNHIYGIGPGIGNNSYGITMSRRSSDSGNTTSQPNSSYITVGNNVVDNVPSWECFDTHGGINITFTGNVGSNCKWGMAIGPSANSLGVYSYPPLGVTVSGNTFTSGVTNGSRANCIYFQGANSSNLATGSISGNSCTNFGDQTNGVNGGGLLIEYTYGLTIQGNSFLYPSPFCVMVYDYNYGTTFNSNTCLDPWTNSAVGEAAGIYSNASNNIGITINGNTIRSITGKTPSGGTPTYSLTTASGVGIDLRATSSSVTIGQNSMNATTNISNGGNQSILTTTQAVIPPTTCTNYPSGTIRNNSGTLAICP